MTIPSRTLLVLAALAPGLAALDVVDDDFKLGLKLQLQVRAEKSWCESTTGARFDPMGNGVAEPDSMDFYIRRARIGFNGTYKGVYRFAYLLRNDNQDKTSSTTAVGNRVPETHVAYLARDWKMDYGTHQVRAGLDYAFFNGASLNSAGWSPVVAARATEQAAMLAPRGVGVGYKLIAPRFTVGLDAQNNVNDTDNDVNNGVTNDGEGLFYGTRAEIVAWDDAEQPHMKPQESFLGAAGKGVLVTVEAGVNQNDNVAVDLNADGDTTDPGEADTTTVTTSGGGVEVFVHWDALTAVAEYRQIRAKTKSAIAGNSDVDRVIWLVQAAWAMPAAGFIVEPGVRFTRIDLDDDADESANYGSGEYGVSGDQIDAGVTLYLNKNVNKVAVGYQHWESEIGLGTADVVRAQWSLSF